MASPLQVETFNLLKRSVHTFRPIVVSTYHLLSIHSKRRLYSENTSQRRPFSYLPSHYSEKTGQKGPFSSRFALQKVDLRRLELFNGYYITSARNFTTMPIDVSFDRAWLERQMKILPGVDSILFTRLEEGKHIVVNVPGLEKTENEEGLCVSVNMPRVEKKDVSARIDGKYLLIQGKTHEEIYLAGMNLPVQFNKNSDLKGKMENGMLKLTLPRVGNQEIMKATSIAYCYGNNIYRHFGHANYVIYSDILFDWSYLGRRYGPKIAQLEEGSRSFTMYKKQTDDRLYLKASVPGIEKMELTSEHLYISLIMPGFEIEDLELFYNYNTLFIEGRRETEHYVTGIRIPQGFHKQINKIKREMRDGVYKATLTRVTKEEEEMEKRKANGEFYIT